VKGLPTILRAPLYFSFWRTKSAAMGVSAPPPSMRPE